MGEITSVIKEQLKTVVPSNENAVKSFEVNKLYALFFSNHSFQFAVDTLLPRSTYKRTLNSAFGNFDLLGYTDSYSSWDNSWQDETLLVAGGEGAIAVKATSLLPSHLIVDGKISFENLLAAHYTIVSAIASNPSFLDFYFRNWSEYKKKNPLITTINLALKDSYKIRLVQKSWKSRFKLCRDNIEGKSIKIGNLYGLFTEFQEFTFAQEFPRCDNTYRLCSAFSDDYLLPAYEGSIRGKNGFIARKLVIESPKLLPPQILTVDTVDKDTLFQIQQQIRNIINQNPELLDAYFPKYDTSNGGSIDNLLSAISHWRASMFSKEEKSEKEKQYHK